MSDTTPTTSFAPPPPSELLQGTDYLPAEKDVLAVAWIGSHFEAAAMRKGAIVSDAITFGECGSSDAFEANLDKTLAKLGFKGSNAELLIDGGLLETTNITLPPVKSRQQESFVREKARRLQTATSPLVWESQRIAAAKSGPRVLLHSIHKAAFNELESQFADRGLSLKKVLPFMGTATRPFKDVQTPADSASIVLAPIGASYKILAIDHAGDLQFARDLNKENSTDPQRVAVEINRCILFARQQFGKPVSQIVTVGLQAARFKSVIKTLLQGEIPIIHRSIAKNLWLVQLSGSNAHNLAKESMLQDRKLRLRKVVCSATFLLAGAGMLGFAYETESKRQETIRHLAFLAANEENMTQTIAEAQTAQSEAERLNSFLNDAESLGRLPVEQALLNFLATHLPADTWTSELEINWKPEQSAWSVRILLNCDADSSVAERRKESLQNALRNSPFAMSFPDNALDRVRRVSTRSANQNTELISIEGMIALGGSSHVE